MATYYIAEGGTAANKAAATSGTYPTGCMSPAVHNGETFAADDEILLSDEGGVIRAEIIPPTPGTSGHPISYGAKAGDSPEVSGADDWLASSVLSRALYFPTGLANGDYVSTADAASLDIIGDIELRIDVLLPDWTPASDCLLITKWGANPNCSYRFMVQGTSGNLAFYTDPDGDYGDASYATRGQSFTDGQRVQIRVTKDVDNGSVGNDTAFYYKLSGDLSSSSGWTQIGATVTNAGTTSIASGAAKLMIGGEERTADSHLSGSVFRAMVYDGVGGTVVYDARFEDENAATTSFTESSASGHTVTITQSGGTDIEITDISDGGFVWAESSSGTNEWYLIRSDADEPTDGVPVTEGGAIFLDDVRMVSGTIGSLDDHEWAYGDNDTLGYDTTYIRDDSGDPNSSGVKIEVSSRNNCILIEQSYLTFNDIVCEKSLDHNVYCETVGVVGVSFGSVTSNRAYRCGFQHYVNSGTNDDWLYEDCVSSYNGGSGYWVRNHAYDCIYRRCVASYNCLYYDNTDQELQWTAGFKANDNWVEGLIYEYCESHHNISTNETCGVGFWPDGVGNGGDTAPTVRFCISHHNSYDGIRVEADTDDAKVLYNICYSNDATGIQASSTGDGPHGTLVYGNICTKNTWGLRFSGSNGGTDTITGTICKNNISHDNKPLLCIYGAENDGTMGSGNIYDNNCFGTAYAGFIGWGIANEYDTYAEWETAHGESWTQVESPASFTDPDNDDYTLASDSPCIDTGADLGSSYDDALLPASTWPDGVVTDDQDNYGAGWEIGAYVYGSVLLGVANASLALSSDSLDIDAGASIVVDANRIAKIIFVMQNG